jgi:hypothetical protein
MFLTSRSAYELKEKPSLYIHINRCRICSNYPRVTFVRTIQISTTVRLYVHLRHQNIHNHNIKQSLLLQYLSLTAGRGQLDRSVHNYWIIVPLLGRRWLQSNLHRPELNPPPLRALLVLNCWWLCTLFTVTVMTPVWWCCTCSIRQAVCAYSICYADKYVHWFFHSILWLFVNITISLIFSWLWG